MTKPTTPTPPTPPTPKNKPKGKKNKMSKNAPHSQSPIPLDDLLSRWYHYRQLEGRKASDSSDKVHALFSLAKQQNAGYLTQEVVDAWYQWRDGERYDTYYERLTATTRFLRFSRDRGYAPITIPPLPIHPRQEGTITYLPTEQELLNLFRAADEACEEHFLPLLKSSSSTTSPAPTASSPTNSPQSEEEAAFQAPLLRVVPPLMGRSGEAGPGEATLPIIFRLMASAGLRPLEARMLRRQDVNLATGMVHIVNTKGYRQHNVVLHPLMRQLMADYDALMDRLIPHRTCFFPDKDDTFHTAKWLNDRFKTLWCKYNKLPEGHKTISAYMLRHDYATKNVYAITGKDHELNMTRLLALSKSMGHSRLKSTMYYFHLTPIMAKAMDALTVSTYNSLTSQNPVYDKDHSNDINNENNNSYNTHDYDNNDSNPKENQ